jgi:hypothetical protein
MENPQAIVLAPLQAGRMSAPTAGGNRVQPIYGGALSAAYYAVFHFVVAEGADLFFGRGNP